MRNIDQLLKRPLPISERFEIENISFANAITHPVLSTVLEDFHDRLYWSKDMPEVGAAGIERFLLVFRFIEAGHPRCQAPGKRRYRGIH